MPSELRGGFHRQLDALDISVVALLGLLPDAARQATSVLVGDGDLSGRVQDWRGLVEELYGGVAATVESIVARQAPVAGDLRFLLTCLRLVPILHDSVDAIAEVAAPGAHLGPELPLGTVDLLTETGEAAADALAAVGALWSTRATGPQDVDHHAARVTVGRERLRARLASDHLEANVVMELALAGRALERLGQDAARAAEMIARLGPKQPWTA